MNGNSAVAPNTYSITINLAQHYSSVPDGTMVFGFNLLFQNQFRPTGGGNDQTVDLYIDLADAMKNSTLSAADTLNTNDFKISVNHKKVRIEGLNDMVNVSIFNILGQNTYHREGIFVDENSCP